MSEQQISAKKVSTANADSYKWGDECDGWHLVRTPQLSIIEESMPPGTSEHRHYHRYARQFFYVLEGELAIEIEGAEISLAAGEGLEIPPEQNHQVMNRSDATARFLVTSQPPSHGDRVDS